MATKAAISIRRQTAIERIAKALDVDLGVQSRDADMGTAILLERIADAVETQPPADLRTVVLASTDDELKELGLSATAIKKLREATE